MRALAVVVALVVAGFALSLPPAFLGAIAVGRLGYGLDSAAFVVVSLTANALGLGGAGAAYARRWLGGLRIEVPDAGDVGWVVAGAAVSVFLALFLQVVYEALGGQSGTTLVTDAIVAEPAFAATYALVSVLAVAPGEELLFRGAIQRRLGLVVSPRISVVGASAFFAAPHFLNVVGAGVSGLFVAGTVFLVSLVWGRRSSGPTTSSCRF